MYETHGNNAKARLTAVNSQIQTSLKLSPQLFLHSVNACSSWLSYSSFGNLKATFPDRNKCMPEHILKNDMQDRFQIWTWFSTMHTHALVLMTAVVPWTMLITTVFRLLQLIAPYVFSNRLRWSMQYHRLVSTQKQFRKALYLLLNALFWEKIVGPVVQSGMNAAFAMRKSWVQIPPGPPIDRSNATCKQSLFSNKSSAFRRGHVNRWR